MSKNVAVILASGSGSRFESKIPKQFVKLAGKPVISYTIEAFEHSKSIDEIIIVTREDYIDYVYELITTAEFKKVSKVISGGKERYDSTLSALEACGSDNCNLIIHDAVRPFISDRIIRDCVTALESNNAVDVVVDAIDTIVQVYDNKLQAVPDRRFLKRGQTPQAFKKETLEQAYKLFMQDKERVASDDCGIVLKYLPNEPIVTVQGEESNFKLTHPQDLYLADNIIKDGLFEQLEHNNDAIKEALNNKVVIIIGGSSGIGEECVSMCQLFGAKTYSFSRSQNGVDVADMASIKNAFAKVHAKEGQIDFVVNTTGLLLRKPLMTMSEEEITSSYMVNYVGVINVSQAAYPYLKTSRGMLLHFTSSSFTRGRPNYSLYSSSKAAVVNFTQAVAQEWLPHGIKVNCINPERTDTPMRRNNFGKEPESSLLSAKEVAEYTLSAMSFDHSGQVFSIKNDV